MPFRIATLVKTVLADRTGDERPDLHFRIDVFAWPDGTHSCEVWRMDLYRIKPTSTFFRDDSAGAPGAVADEDVMVLEGGINWCDLRARTPDELLNLVFDAIEWQLGDKVERTAKP